MTRLMRVSVTACMIVLLGGPAFAQGGRTLRWIVVFQEGTSSQVQQQVVAESGSRLLRALSLINGVAISLPAANAGSARAFLQAHPAVEAVHDDPVIRAQGTVVAQGAGADGAGGDGAGGDGAGGDGAGGDGAGGDGAGGDGAGGDGAGGDGAGGDGAGGDGAGGDRVVFVTPVGSPRREIHPWGIDRIGAADVQRVRHGVAGGGVKIAVFDTGVDRNHPELARNIVGGFNAIADADPRAYDDDNGHGTAMAGIIAARVNREGVIGGAPRAVLYAVKVLDRNGQGHTSDTIYALEVIASRPDIRVINMSYGTSLVWPLFEVAVQRSRELGKIIVASRGNRCTAGTAASGAGGDGTGGDGAGGDGAGGDGAGGDGAGGDGAGGDGAGGDGAGGDGAGGDGAGGDARCSASAVKYPAAYPDVIAVGATTARDWVAWYSLQRGVDVVAPGGDGARQILTTNRGGGHGLITGTSPATAHVSAGVALALQLRPRLSFEGVVHLLQRTANHLDCPAWPDVAGCPVDRQGAGLIDVKALVDELRRSRSDDD